MSRVQSGMYRKIYAEYYNIQIPDDMDIHHIDENRENNDISNLLMLPHDLHNLYHTWKQEYLKMTSNEFDCTLNGYNQYKFDVLAEFGYVLRECQKWMLYKEELGMKRWMSEVSDG